MLMFFTELAQLSGIAAMLRFPMPELEDEDEIEDENDSDDNDSDNWTNDILLTSIIKLPFSQF